MTALPANYLARIANFYGSKLEELRFHLENIVDSCDESLKLFKLGQQHNDKTGRPLTFSFSSYANTIQTLKDAAGMLKEGALPWSEITSLRHGSFMKGARNAITHDGNPIISAWADGRYFVPNKIVRLERIKGQDKVVVIEPPTADVRQFCLEFTADFASLLSKTLKEIPDNDCLSMTIFDIREIDEVFQESSFIPEFAKKLVAEQCDRILEALRNTKTLHVEDAVKKADDLTAYCIAKLAETAVAST